MSTLSITVTTSAELRKKLDSLKDPALATGILDEAESMLLNRIRTRFLAEEGPHGKWKPSQAGLLRKAGKFTWSNGRKWTGTGTLFASGTLFHSIQAHKTGPNSRAISTDVYYGMFLQKSQHGPWVFLGANADDLSMIEKGVVRRIKALLQ